MSSVVRPFGAGRAFERQKVRRESWAVLACDWLARAWQTHSTRNALAELDARELSDLGISRAQARFEANRPFWDMHNGR